jgi:hypothetical protein
MRIWDGADVPYRILPEIQILNITGVYSYDTIRRRFLFQNR